MPATFYGVAPVKYVSAQTTNSSGTWTGQVMAGLRYWVQPVTAGNFVADTVTLSGTNLTVTFKKLRTGGLGLNLGTLLSVSIFEDSSGTIAFNLFGAEDMT